MLDFACLAFTPPSYFVMLAIFYPFNLFLLGSCMNFFQFEAKYFRTIFLLTLSGAVMIVFDKHIFTDDFINNLANYYEKIAPGMRFIFALVLVLTALLAFMLLCTEIQKKTKFINGKKYQSLESESDNSENPEKKSAQKERYSEEFLKFMYFWFVFTLVLISALVFIYLEIFVNSVVPFFFGHKGQLLSYQIESLIFIVVLKVIEGVLYVKAVKYFQDDLLTLLFDLTALRSVFAQCFFVFLDIFMSIFKALLIFLAIKNILSFSYIF